MSEKANSVTNGQNLGSRASQRAGPKSYVDESLFGGNKPGSTQQNRKGAQDTKFQTSAGIISMDELRTIRGKTEKNNQNDAVIISKNDLDRIKEATVIKTKEQISMEKSLLEEQKNAALAKSKARKVKMQEMDAQRAQKVQPSEHQKIQNVKNQTLLSKAQKKLDEEMDDVKQMNQMVLYSKVVTIRDKQLEENKRLEQEWIEEQKKLDLMMEIERLKVLQEEEERENRKHQARKQGAKVIIDQIQERTIQRMKEQEVRDKERIELLQNIEKMRKEDQAQAELKKQRINNLMKQAAEANAQSLIEKEKRSQEEKDQENSIIAYQRAKDQKEYEAQLEAQRIKEEKEREIQRLRELQEKAADRQAEIDALRAKRAFEEGERQARERERLEALKRQRIQADLEVARQRQFSEKQLSLAEQARIEREDYMSQIQKQKQIEMQEKSIEEEKRQALIEHSYKIRGQISTKEALKKQDRLDYLEEGRKVREKIENERQKIKEIQVAKIDELTSAGIDKKYLYELQKKTVSF